MSREITQRELRNNSGAIMRSLDDGESFVVTRNGVPVGELSPLRRSRFADIETVMAVFRAAPAVDYARLAPTSTRLPSRTYARVADAAAVGQGLLDTSVVIDLERLEVERLPAVAAISAITIAELSAGPHATRDADERARRLDRLQRVEATFEPLPFDTEAARAYGRIFAAVTASGRKARGARVVDLLIAATAVAHRLPLYTRNAADFRALDDILEVIEV